MRWTRLATALALLPLLGCFPGRWPEQFAGHYEVHAPGVAIELDVHPDRSYIERIAYPNERSAPNRHSWLWTNGSICFQHFVVPRAVIPRELLDLYAPSASSAESRHSVDENDWCLAAETDWGRKRLVVFPDQDVYFLGSGKN